MTEKPHNTETWYERAFDAVYREVYPHRSDEQAVEEVDFVLRSTTPQKRLPVLDLCCGHGRHSSHLVARGYRVVGIDLSADLIRDASERRLEHALFARADMRRLPLRDRSFGLVASFFTSFGYFETETEDLKVLLDIARVLHLEGSFVLDFLNADQVRSALVASSSKRSGIWEVSERRRIDENRGRVLKDVDIVSDDGRRKSYHESVRLYSADDLIRLCDRAGLQIDHIHGGFDGSTHHTASPRTLLQGRLRP